MDIVAIIFSFTCAPRHVVLPTYSGHFFGPFLYCPFSGITLQFCSRRKN
uniref:Uncharacterized protein n=1 Tax=Manihot esculenta TaxID=3983 RepID=A0A2C9V252_MANES